MFKQVEKKKPKKFRVADSEAASIVCGACNYERQPTDRNPDWQCPGCGAAYNKVDEQADEELMSREQLRAKNQAYLRKRKEESRGTTSESLEEVAVKTSLGIGAMMFLNGLGRAASACVKVAVPANPWLQAAGALIVIGTLVYAAIRYLT